MASGKGRRDNQHDKSKDDNDATTIINTPHRLEELRTTVQNLQWNQIKQQDIVYEELGDSQQESWQQAANPLPPILRQETQCDIQSSRLESREFEDTVDPDEVKDFMCYLHAQKRSLMLVRDGQREN